MSAKELAGWPLRYRSNVNQYQIDSADSVYLYDPSEAVVERYEEFAQGQDHWDLPGDLSFVAGWKAALQFIAEQGADNAG